MRNKESEFRTERVRFINEKNEIKQQLEVSEQTVAEWTDKSNKLSDEVARLQADIATTEKEYAHKLKHAADKENTLRTDLSKLQNSRDRLEADLRNSEKSVPQLKEEVAEEQGKRTRLEEENQ